MMIILFWKQFDKSYPFAGKIIFKYFSTFSWIRSSSLHTLYVKLICKMIAASKYLHSFQYDVTYIILVRTIMRGKSCFVQWHCDTLSIMFYLHTDYTCINFWISRANDLWHFVNNYNQLVTILFVDYDFSFGN